MLQATAKDDIKAVSKGKIPYETVREFKDVNGHTVFKPFKIDIDLSNDRKFGEASIANLSDRYLLPTEDSPQEAMARACCHAADDEDHAQRLYDYISNMWFMFSSPIISNLGADNKGLPIACFLGQVGDSLDPSNITGLKQRA